MPVLVKLIEKSTKTGEEAIHKTCNVNAMRAIGKKGLFCPELYSESIQADIAIMGGVDIF